MYIYASKLPFEFVPVVFTRQSFIFHKVLQNIFPKLVQSGIYRGERENCWGGNYKEDMAMGNRDDRRDGMAGPTLNIGCKVEENDYRGGISASKKVLETKCKQANKAI